MCTEEDRNVAMDSGVTHLHIREEMRKHFKWMIGILVVVITGLAGSFGAAILDQQKEIGAINSNLAVVTDNLADAIDAQVRQDTKLERSRTDVADLLTIVTKNQMGMLDRLHEHEMKASRFE
jgi:hypothetical protein